MKKHPLEAAMEALGITVSSKFVPFSRSRNKDQKTERGNPLYSLNWKVTVSVNGRAVMTTDYMAGSGNCPSNNKPAPKSWDRPARFWRDAVCEWECENGFEAITNPSWAQNYFSKKQAKRSDADIEAGRPRTFYPIEPKAADVIYCLISDASVLDYPGFEAWASEYGYETDSRKAEATYRECLELALALRSGLGNDAMKTLAEAGQDY